MLIMISTVGIVGYGNFGSFVYKLGQQFFSEIEFKINSRRFPTDGKKFFDLKEVAQADVVFLCAKISEYEERMQEILKHALPNTIFVDVAAAKVYTSELCQKYCQGKKFISIHPMFGASSLAKTGGKIKDFKIVATDYALKNDTYQMLKTKFSKFGFDIIEMTPDEHDKNLAETLFITHYISEAVAKTDTKRTEIDTLAFQFLMDAVDSVKDDKVLFKDIYQYNPYCKQTAENFRSAMVDVLDEL